MGRQIDFYMDEVTQKEFITYLKKEELIIFARSGPVNDPNDEPKHQVHLYKPQFGTLVTLEDRPDLAKSLAKFRTVSNSEILFAYSPVIEYCVPSIQGNIVKGGRLWITNDDRIGNESESGKGKAYIAEYEKLCRWIKKNVPYQDIPIGNSLFKYYANDELLELIKNGYKFLCL